MSEAQSPHLTTNENKEISNMEVKKEEKTKKVRKRIKGLLKNIQSQMEFYFSDANFQKDRFIKQETDKSPDGYVNLSLFLNFNKIKLMTDDLILISKAVSKSDKLVLSEDGFKVKRKTPFVERDMKEVDSRTVYVECLPKTVDHDWMKKVFGECGTINYVSLPKFKTTGDPKGFGFVEFESKEAADKACELLNNPPIEAEGKPGKFPKSNKQLEQLKRQGITDEMAEELMKENETKSELSPMKSKRKRRRNTSESSVDYSDCSTQKRAKRYSGYDEKSSDGNETSRKSLEDSFNKSEDEGKRKKKKKKKKNRRSQDTCKTDEESESTEPVRNSKCVTGENGRKCESLGKHGIDITADCRTDSSGNEKIEENKDITNTVGGGDWKSEETKKNQTKTEESIETEVDNSEKIQVKNKKADKNNRIDEKGNESNKQHKNHSNLTPNDKKNKIVDKCDVDSEQKVDILVDKIENVETDTRIGGSSTRKRCFSEGEDHVKCENDVTPQKRKRKMTGSFEKGSDGKLRKKPRNSVEFSYPVAQTINTQSQDLVSASSKGKSKKSRKRRKKKEEKVKEAETLHIRVLPKTEWSKLRKEYLTKQKTNMSVLKQKLHGYQTEHKPTAPEIKEKTIDFTPGVIVHVKSEVPLERKQMKEVFDKDIQIAYIDVVDSSMSGYVRCKDVFSAHMLVNSAIDNYTLQLLTGEDEQKYWQKLTTDRENKLTNKKRPKKRGMQKLVDKAEKIHTQTLTKQHVFFDD